jgi:DNA-directed RNA polymerase specialized sigma24 family protein
VVASKSPLPPLGDQPEGIQRLVAEITATAITLMVGPQGHVPQHTSEHCRHGVWNSLKFHSVRSGRDIRATADCLEEKQLPRNAADTLKVDGNLLHEIVLARLVQAGCEPAIVKFRERYAGHFQSLCRKFPELAADSSPVGDSSAGAVDFFLSEMALGRINLDNYEGKAPLGAWLLQVSKWRLARMKSRPGGDFERNRSGADADSVLAVISDAENQSATCRQLLVELVRDSFLQCQPPLTERERRVLALRIFNGLSNTVVAQKIGVHPGNTAREYQSAVRKLAETLQQLLAERCSTTPALQNCIAAQMADSNYSEVSDFLRNFVGELDT